MALVLLVAAALALVAAPRGHDRERAPGPRLAVPLALLAALAAVFAALLVSVVGEDGLVSIDRPVATFLIEHRERWLTRVFEVLTWMGSTILLAPIVLATGLLLRRRTASWRPLAFLATCLAGAGVLANVVKLAVGRARPDDRLVHAIGFAFPSGHATNAAAGWLALALTLSALTTASGRRMALFAAAVVIAAIVGLSRVYLRVHYPTDVLAGWALGGAWVVVVVVASAALERRRA